MGFSISFLETSLWFVSAACFLVAVLATIRRHRRASPAGVPGKIVAPPSKDTPAQAPPLPKDEPLQAKSIRETPGERSKLRIGQILLHNNIITKDILDKALEHQKQYGGTVTQYLLHYGYIDEKQLAHCLSLQFKVPYLPLNAYEISDDIVKFVPVDIAEKYWVMPVDRQGDSLMVVMIDPLDTKAIKELEEITGLDIIPFVGIISEIASALRSHYRILMKDKDSKLAQLPPFFIDTKTYTGIERRHTIRYNAKVDVSFPVQGRYKKTKTTNVSRGGFAFESDEAIDLGAVITLEIDLPREYSPLPISAVTQVVRCVPKEKKRFEIGVKILKISKEEIGTIIAYASRHVEV